MKWVYNDSPVNSIADLPDDAYGFVYMLVFTNNMAYIGQKALYSTRTLPALKNGSIRPKATRIYRNISGKRVPFDKIAKESNWFTYTSSCKDIPLDAIIQDKLILEIAYDKRHLTYLETKYLFQYEVLEHDHFYNANILGKFYPNVIPQRSPNAENM